MLRELSIRDMLLIQHLELEFYPGLNVLTGETGAGKSILLHALGFVLGGRGRSDMVRSGAKQGEVTASFEIPLQHPAVAILQDAEIPHEGELLLRRINTKDGRKSAWINDRRVSAEALRALSEHLVEVHGQHDDRGLLNSGGHRAMLDQFADIDLGTLRSCWREQAKMLQTLEKARADHTALANEGEYLRHAVDELDMLAPEAGEEAELDTRRRLMQAAGRIRTDIIRAHEALEGQEGAERRMMDALRWMEGVADQAEGTLDASLQALNRAMVELGETQAELARVIETLAVNPGKLEEVEERLFALRAAARKYDVPVDDLGPHAETLRTRRSILDAGEETLAALEADVAAAQRTYQNAAQEVRAARQKAASKLDAAVMSELASLKMERAVFQTVLQNAEPTREGIDNVMFSVATNPGTPPGPLAKIASGGELSRFLLALKVCLASEGPGQTMIFDEIDRGVGGATADAVGRRLQALSSHGQILVVTHSPQVAALGHHHLRVKKHTDGAVTTSTVMPLSAEGRVDEIARMLSGDRVTDAAKEAAKALLVRPQR